MEIKKTVEKTEIINMSHPGFFSVKDLGEVKYL